MNPQGGRLGGPLLNLLRGGTVGMLAVSALALAVFLAFVLVFTCFRASEWLYHNIFNAPW